VRKRGGRGEGGILEVSDCLRGDDGEDVVSYSLGESDMARLAGLGYLPGGPGVGANLGASMTGKVRPPTRGLSFLSFLSITLKSTL